MARSTEDRGGYYPGAAGVHAATAPIPQDPSAAIVVIYSRGRAITIALPRSSTASPNSAIPRLSEDVSNI